MSREVWIGGVKLWGFYNMASTCGSLPEIDHSSEARQVADFVLFLSIVMIISKTEEESTFTIHIRNQNTIFRARLQSAYLNSTSQIFQVLKKKEVMCTF